MKTFTRPKRWTALLAILALGSAAFSTGCVLDQATPVVSVVGAGVVAAYGNTTLPPDVASVLSKASAAICPDVMLIQQLGLTTTGTIAGNSENAAVALCANGNPTNVSIAVSDIETLWAVPAQGRRAFHG
jgi:hypothetical protein